MRVRTPIVALASLCGALFACGALTVVPSVAAVEDPGTGYIEICKTLAAGPAGSPQYQGTFTYTISDGSGRIPNVNVSAIEGGPQVCTAPISVPSGTATVTEVAAPWFSVASVTATQGDPGTVTQSGTNPYQATLTVKPAPSAGNQSLTTTVQYTNDPVTGVVEVCKQAATNSPSLTGTYAFNVTSEEAGITVLNPVDGEYDLPWSTTASATISGSGLGCSGPITVPAGSIQTVEPGTTYVTAITATSNGANELTSVVNQAALNDGTANERVLAGTTTNQTIVTYTDALSTVKLCKEWSGETVPATSFPFTLSSSGAAGPTAVTASLGLTPGDCQIVGTVRAGTQVNITEGIVPGTKVGSITVSPTSNSQGASPIVAGSLSLPNRTVSVIAGAGETDVYFTDKVADPGTLKICVAPTTDPAAGSVPFTVNGTQTVDVNLSSTAVQCTLDTISTFPFDSSVTIAGGALPTGDAYTGTPSVVPTSVEVLEGSPATPTVTNQSSLTASTASSATVLMSEDIVEEVTFTVDPPAPATGPPVTVNSGGAVVTLTPAGTPAGTPSGSSAGTPAAGTPVVTPAGTSTVTALTIKTRLTLDRLVASSHGSRHVALKVVSAGRLAIVRLTLRERIMHDGHAVIRTVHRTVTVLTNRTISISVPADVIKVSAKLA